MYLHLDGHKWEVLMALVNRQMQGERERKEKRFLMQNLKFFITYI